MKLLKTIKQNDLFPAEKLGNSANFDRRSAARAVVFDDENKIAILNVSRHGYHKLPGGGVEDGEDIAKALEREMKEEIGSQISVVSEIGEIVEYKDKENLRQQSFCWLAKLVGEKGQPILPRRSSKVALKCFGFLWLKQLKSLKMISQTIMLESSSWLEICVFYRRLKS